MKKMTGRCKLPFACAIAVLVPVLLWAQPQQSENFRITKSVIDAGGAVSASENFRLTSAFGQPSPIGQQSSSDFVLYAGFLSPEFAVSPLSPIQRLVIQALLPNVRLTWESIAGAAQYNIYRSTDPLFTPGPGNLLGSTSDTTFTDLNIVGLPLLRNYYNVTALSSGGVVIAVEQPAAVPRISKQRAGTKD